jgi:hypothetical protein
VCFSKLKVSVNGNRAKLGIFPNFKHFAAHFVLPSFKFYFMLSMLLISAGLIVVFMTAVWLLSLYKQDMSIVDGFWGLGFIAVTHHWFFRLDDITPKQFIIAYLITLWGLRLAVYIFYRNIGKGEDPRYVAFRNDWKENTWYISFYKVFMLQGFLQFVLLLPIIFIMYNGDEKLSVPSSDRARTAICCRGSRGSLETSRGTRRRSCSTASRRRRPRRTRRVTPESRERPPRRPTLPRRRPRSAEGPKRSGRRRSPRPLPRRASRPRGRRGLRPPCRRTRDRRWWRRP